MSCDCRRDESRMTELKWLFFQEKVLEGNCLKGLLVKDKVQAEVQRVTVRTKHQHPNGFLRQLCQFMFYIDKNSCNILLNIFFCDRLSHIGLERPVKDDSSTCP